MTEPLVVPDSDLDFDSDLVFTLNGAAFTGIAYEESAELWRSEITYRDGIQEGAAREWSPPGSSGASRTTSKASCTGRPRSTTTQVA